MVQISKLGEKGLLQFVAKDLQHFSNAFAFMEQAALGGYLRDWVIECHLSVPSQELELTGTLPGDIDVLLIPSFDGDRFAERAMAMEVKRCLIPKDRRGRSPSSYGSQQVQGLANNGFPLIGLLHLAIIERSDDDQWIEMPILKEIVDGECIFEGTTLVDPASEHFTNRHLGRIEQLDIPHFSGYNIHSLNLTEDGDAINGWSLYGWRHPRKNPKTDPILLERIRTLSREPDFFVERKNGGGSVRWNPMYRLEF